MFCCGLVNLLEEVQQVLEAETGAFERDGTPSMARWREEESMGGGYGEANSALVLISSCPLVCPLVRRC